jgi:hypothetical protein
MPTPLGQHYFPGWDWTILQSATPFSGKENEVNPFVTQQVAERHAAEHAKTGPGTDLVIVTLDELACSGWARSCSCIIDYASMTPAAVAA